MFGAFDRMMTTILNSCQYYRCHWCNTKGWMRDALLEYKGQSGYPLSSYLHECDKKNNDPEGRGKHNGKCNSCYYCSYESGIWFCNSKEKH